MKNDWLKVSIMCLIGAITTGCQVILYSYIFKILLYFLYLPKISYISSQNPIFFKNYEKKS